jgi:hypothetical protein
MDELQQESIDSQLYHFSRKVVILSLLFFAVNLGLYLMILFGQSPQTFREVAPRLVFAGSQDVFVKAPYDEAYLSAKSDQTLLNGMSLKTGNQSFAEVQLEGNAIRLDQNTEIQLLENHFRADANPRLVFGLVSGSVWVNAFDPIAIRTAQAEIVFSHDVGTYTYTPPLNRVMSITQSADLALRGPEGKPLTQLTIPLKNQVAFTDSQLIPEYSRLEYSKLKKELKLGPVSKSIFSEDWIQRNTADDLKMYLAENHYIFSQSTYNLEDRYYSALETLSFVPPQRTAAHLARANILLKYLLGGVQAQNALTDAKDLLDKFSTLIGPIQDNPSFNDLIARQFYAIQNARPKTPAYLTREKLRSLLYSKDHPEFLRTYLSDVDFLLRILETEQAQKTAEAWLAKWDDTLIKRFPKEFNLESRVYHSIMVANADRIDNNLLAVLEKAEDARLANSTNPQDTLFEIAMERLDISKYLVAANRYAEAKTYLLTSYSKLNLGEGESSAAAREIFVKDATLLADRIAFAEQTMHGAAGSMDEGAFIDYLSTQERDKTIEQRFNAFLEEAKTPEVQKTPPKVQEISQRFAASRIAVLEDDIAPKPDFSFEFLVKNARLVDRASDGTDLVFQATYDSTTNAVYDIILNGKALKGNYVLDDFVRIALSGEKTITPETGTKDSTGDAGAFLNLSQTEEAKRSQVIAQDLAAQLLVSELKKDGIEIVSSNQVFVLDLATLTKFHVAGAILEDVSKKRTLKIDFDYNSATKMLSAVAIEGLTVDLPPEVPAAQFATAIFNVIYGKEEQEKAMKAAIDDLDSAGFQLKAQDAKFADAPLNLVEFQTMRLKAMPVELSGVYDRAAKVFVSVQNPLLSQENVSLSDYASKVAMLWVIDALGKHGIAVTEANIKTRLPSDKVTIEDYVRGGKTLNFTYDVANNRLVDIALQGSAAKVTSMTFEEFNLIGGGGESSAPSAPSASTSEPTMAPTPGSIPTLPSGSTSGTSASSSSGVPPPPPAP